MPKPSKPIEVETTFESYRLDEIIGEGGSGRVYGGRTSDGKPVAIKFLNRNVASDKRK